MNNFIELDSIKVPSLGLGTYGMDDNACSNAVTTALHIGYRHLDTAQMYNNEEAVGTGISKSDVNRSAIFLTTKVLPVNFSKAKFIPSVEESLRKLKCEYIDLLLIHWPSDETSNQIAVEQLLLCKDKCYAKLIGVSNFTLNQMKLAQKSAPVICNQVEYHPYLGQHLMLEYLQQQELMLTAYRPLAMGKVLKEPLIINLAVKYNRTPNQIVLRWLIQQKNVAVIPKASNEKHQQSNFEIFNFSLLQDDMNRIFNLNTGTRFVDPTFAPDWD
ncbi:MAG: aldo/keto reductase [Bacteroidia bacterium]|nr:aldo/keto reductase [Bacteroidia bacterium]